MFDRLGVRRLVALFGGLPPDAAVRRVDAFPPAEEFAAKLVEQLDDWMSVLFRLRFFGDRRVEVPAVHSFVRPGDEPPREIESDPRQIAAWFSKHIQEGG